MNRFIYPQGPSPANVKLKRLDEASDPTDVRSFDKVQEEAVIGETIPLVFCKREAYKKDDEGNDVERGGVWVAPRIIALGLKDNVFSLLYVLTQGQIVTLDKKDVKYGATDIPEMKDTDDKEVVNHCLDYQKIPGCVEINYSPGGNLGWTNTVVSIGPSLSMDQSEDRLATWTSTTSKCSRIAFNFTGAITVEARGTYVRPRMVSHSSGMVPGIVPVILGTSTNGGMYSNNLQPPYVYQMTTGFAGASQDLSALTNGEVQPTGFDPFYGNLFDQSAALNREMAWMAFSYRTWSYRVIDVATDTTVKTGTAKLGGIQPSTTVVIDNLKPAKYRVEFYETTALRSFVPPAKEFSFVSGGDLNNVYISNVEASVQGPEMLKHQNTIFNTYNNSVQEDVAGVETCDMVALEVFENVYEELEFPDDPNGTVGTAGEFTDLTLVGLTGPTGMLRPPVDGASFRQINCFCREGIQVKRHMHSMDKGASNNFVDLVLYLLESTQRVPTAQIDYEALLFAARFTHTLKLHFDGALTQTKSFEEWITKTAPFFLLSVRQRDGKLGLAPVLPMDAQYQIDLAPVTPAKVFTLDDIVEGSYSRSYTSAEEKAPVCLIMVFREQPEGAPESHRSIEVRYPGSATVGPFETYDMTEFCISVDHAALVGRYILAQRRYVTHTVSVTVGREAALLTPGDIIQLKFDVDTSDGAKAITSDFLYEVDSIAEAPTGEIELELVHFPVDAAGVSVLAKETTSGAIEIE